MLGKSKILNSILLDDYKPKKFAVLGRLLMT